MKLFYSFEIFILTKWLTSITIYEQNTQTCLDDVFVMGKKQTKILCTFLLVTVSG